jgi:putative PIG3 family NAD(P)H quinone oxidoreductase
VRIRVRAAGLNRADLMQQAGKYPPPPGVTDIPGLEIAGTVDAIGEGITTWQSGQKVMTLLPGGGMAEYAVVDAGSLLPIPDGLSFTDAAALPEAFATAWQALKWVANAQPGERVLIHAGGSGVGTAAIQLGSALGLDVVATASGKKTAACLALGATQAIDYQADDFATVLGPGSVDVVIDSIGAAYWEKNLSVLGQDGTLVLLAAMSGAKVGEMSLAPILLKRLQVQGTTLRSRPDAYKAALMQEMGAFLLTRLADGRIRPVVDSVFPFAEATKAFARLASNQSVGKVVLEMAEI